jgi:hypothetical protein
MSSARSFISSTDSLTVFVPRLTVTGRSVFGRRVRQGIPRTVVSSWIPPESVRTNRADAMRPSDSR